MTIDRAGARRLLAAAALFVALAVIHTWPLATDPGILSRNDNGDAMLNEWILAWIAHQLPRDPWHLFAGNIFYPARDVLAFSEPLIVPALMGAPIRWLGGSPVLAHNLLLIAGFALTGLAAYLVAVSWTRDRYAGALAGTLFAFNTHTLTRTAHIQAVHAYGLPLALFFADRLMVQPGRAAIVGLAASMTILAYTSGYLFVFAALLVGVVVLARIPAWKAHARASIGGVAGAAVLAALAILPLYVPYRRVAIEQGMVRSLETVRQFSATPVGYLAAAGRVHFDTWSARFFENPVDAFFPGIACALLTIVALVLAVRGRTDRGRVVMLTAIGAAGFVLSLGLQTPVYGWLFAVFPPMQGLRAAARFGNLFLLAVALLAAIALAALRAKLPARAAVALGVAVVGIANVEALRAPFDYRRFDGIPALYRLLEDEPGPVVLAETPFYPPHAVFENALYVLYSTGHWKPLMNGYSGYTPDSYRDVAWTFWYFPAEHAIEAMRRAGVTHVTIHTRRFGHDAAKTIEAISHRPDFELLAIDPRRGIRLYRLK